MSTLLFLLLAGPCVAVRQSTHDQPSVGEYEIQGQRIRLTQVGEIGDGEDIRWAKPERPQSQKAAAENLMETKAEVRGCPSGAEVWEETGKTLGSGAMGKVVEVESKVHSGGKYAMKLPFEGAVEEAEQACHFPYCGVPVCEHRFVQQRVDVRFLHCSRDERRLAPLGPWAFQRARQGDEANVR